MIRARSVIAASATKTTTVETEIEVRCQVTLKTGTEIRTSKKLCYCNGITRDVFVLKGSPSLLETQQKASVDTKLFKQTPGVLIRLISDQVQRPFQVGGLGGCRRSQA